MAQKNATPTREQKRIIEHAGYSSMSWVVVKDLPNSLIIRRRGTSEFQVIQKQGG